MKGGLQLLQEHGIILMCNRGDGDGFTVVTSITDA
jgi:hypothetical protein